MYENFYGFLEKPFHIAPNPKYLYFSSKHQNALTYMEYGIREGAGFVLLTGEIGTGKTTLIRYILNQIEAEMDVAVIFNTNVTSNQFLELVLREFELEVIANDKPKNLETLYQYLIQKYARKEKVLLIIDEAQNLSDDVLEEVRMLTNLQTDDNLLLQIMLVGQPELKAKLKRPSLAQLNQRIGVNYHLMPLTHEETGVYIASRLEKAGGSPDIFTADAVKVIFNATNGIPRLVNLLCDHALVYGYADELKIIDQSVIDQVIEDKGDIGIVSDDEKNVEGEANQIKDGLASDGDRQRLEIIEENIRQLQMQVKWQIEELEKRAENYKDDLVLQLNSQLQKERKSHKKTLISFISHLQKKYSVLKELYEVENKPLSKVEVPRIPINKDEASRIPRKKISWFFRRAK